MCVRVHVHVPNSPALSTLQVTRNSTHSTLLPRACRHTRSPQSSRKFTCSHNKLHLQGMLPPLQLTSKSRWAACAAEGVTTPHCTVAHLELVSIYIFSRMPELTDLYTHAHARTQTHTDTHACLCTTRTCTRRRTVKNKHARIRAHIHTRPHAHTQTRTHTRTQHTHTHHRHRRSPSWPATQAKRTQCSQTWQLHCARGARSSMPHN